MIGCTNDCYAKKIDTTKSIVFGIMIQRKKKNIWNDIDTYVQIKFYQIISSILETNRDKNSRSTLQDEIPLFIIFFFFLHILLRYFQNFRNVSRAKSSKNITYFGIKYHLLIFPVWVIYYFQNFRSARKIHLKVNYGKKEW